MECEAGAKPYMGKVAVANVVFNRIKSNKFPKGKSTKKDIFNFVAGKSDLLNALLMDFKKVHKVFIPLKIQHFGCIFC